MPAPFLVLLILFLIAVALLAAGIVMSIKGTGSTPKRGGWLAVISGLVALCFGVVLGISLIGAAMDDVPGLW
ncbi:hypothetical protein [Agrococcus beijingensis]|uniref:hypothetical protein n=1 Tax=Agrococcus beijingensis TaxID=3068634 RepID=UPI00274125DA|nr:hypothetical protein [Agrococcus sp. REN33]